MAAVLVTGGAGYVGSHACKALRAAGFTPVTYDNLVSGHRELVRWGPLVEGELADVARVRAVLREHACEAVLHFAAHAYVGESVAAPRKYVSNNVGATAALLEAMLDEQVGKIVFSSSCAVYGVPASVPIRETAPLAPVSPYGQSKRYVEEVLASYERAYGMRWAVLRYFNAAGADPDGETGERHDPETHVLPLAIQAARGKGPPLPVYGTDYPTPDGTAVRDYVHVSDIAEAHVKALQRVLDGGASIAANLGTGRGFSVREVVAAVERRLGAAVPRTEAPRRPGDPPELVADPALAIRELGFAPRRSSLEEIVETAVRWHESV